MSETCIVCLGDLGENVNDLPLSTINGSEDLQGTFPDESTSPLTKELDSADKSNRNVELIAHLLPCGHNLHDKCLRPWVERANSCPICRQNFNQVDLCKNTGGIVLSSYTVQDRIQVADVDSSMLIEEYDEPDIQPYLCCGGNDDDDDDDDKLLICHGCEAGYHTYCVSLDAVPVGHWFCDNCKLNHAEEASTNYGTSRSHNLPDRRTRGQQRRSRNRNQAISSSWARVWQSVWDHLNIDLDFPFDENASAAQLRRTRRPVNQRREFLEWERRFQVAERQGGTNRFQDTASTLLDHPPVSRPRNGPELPEPESLEEILAWNALEKARDIEADPTPRSRKRKSTTNSPSEADPLLRRKRRRSGPSSPSDPTPLLQPERPLKRPRTRRTLHHSELSGGSGAESSTVRQRSATLRNGQTPEAIHLGNGPSFLQSLLKEVESSAAPDESKGQTRILVQFPNIASPDYPSPHFSSPGSSPTASNHPSPRALSKTPPPSLSGRPGSPVPLTSKVEPIYPPPEFSLERCSTSENILAFRSHSTVAPFKQEGRRPRPLVQNTAGSSPPRSEDTSPSRASLSLSAKSDIQKMVKDALKFPYQNNQLSKDQYTEINRKISRLLYDRVGDSENLNGDARESWKKVACEEVAKALESLQATTSA